MIEERKNKGIKNESNPEPFQNASKSKELENHEDSGNYKEPRYSKIDCLSLAYIGKHVELILINGKGFEGVLKDIGMFDLRIKEGNNDIIVFKHAVATIITH